jgi:hypothetical protein
MLNSKILHVRHTYVYMNWKKGRILPFMKPFWRIARQVAAPSTVHVYKNCTRCKYIVHKTLYIKLPLVGPLAGTALGPHAGLTHRQGTRPGRHRSLRRSARRYFHRRRCCHCRHCLRRRRCRRRCRRRFGHWQWEEAGNTTSAVRGLFLVQQA